MGYDENEERTRGLRNASNLDLQEFGMGLVQNLDNGKFLARKEKPWLHFA